MKLLLDTHIALWALADRSRPSTATRELLEDPGNECWVSSASAWEPAIKIRLGRLLIAQCQIETLRLLTADRQLATHPSVVQA